MAFANNLNMFGGGDMIPQHQPRNSDQFDAKTAFFYREGDQRFAPVRIVMKKKEYRSMESLINDLNSKISLKKGVRALFTPDGRHRINDLEEIEHEGHYICSQSEVKGQRVDVNNVQAQQWEFSPRKNRPPKLPVGGGGGKNRKDSLRLTKSVMDNRENEMVNREIYRIEQELYGGPKFPTSQSQMANKRSNKFLKRLNTEKSFVSLKLNDIVNRSKPTLPPIKSDRGPRYSMPNGHSVRNFGSLNNSMLLFDQKNLKPRKAVDNSYALLMGDPQRGPGFRHWTVKIATGMMPAGFSSSVVSLTIYGRSGQTPKLTLASEQGAFISGNVDIFKVRSTNVGTVLKIRVEISNSGPQPDWFCENIVLEDDYSLERFPFVCRNWLSRHLGDRSIYREIPAFGEEQMGGAKGANNVSYEISISTGDVWNAATNGKVYLTIFGERGTSKMFEMNNPRNHENEPFLRNQTDVFRVDHPPLGEIRHIRVAHVHGQSVGHNQGWYLDNVAIRENDLHTQFFFPAWRWLSQFDDDKKLAVDLKAIDNYNYLRLQDKVMVNIPSF